MYSRAFNTSDWPIAVIVYPADSARSPDQPSTFRIRTASHLIHHLDQHWESLSHWAIEPLFAQRVLQPQLWLALASVCISHFLSTVICSRWMDEELTNTMQLWSSTRLFRNTTVNTHHLPGTNNLMICPDIMVDMIWIWPDDVCCRTQRQPLQVLPLDAAHRLADLCLCGSDPGGAGCGCVQVWCMCSNLDFRIFVSCWWILMCRRQGKFDMRGKRRGDTIVEW